MEQWCRGTRCPWSICVLRHPLVRIALDDGYWDPSTVEYKRLWTFGVPTVPIILGTKHRHGCGSPPANDVSDTPLHAVPKRRQRHHDATDLVSKFLRNITRDASFKGIPSKNWYILPCMDPVNIGHRSRRLDVLLREDHCHCIYSVELFWLEEWRKSRLY